MTLGIMTNLTKDVSSALLLWRYWLSKAFYLHRAEYRAARLGSGWPVISLLAFAGALSMIWGVLLEKSDLLEYFLYLVSGLCVWQTLSAAVNIGNFGFADEIRTAGFTVSTFAFEKASRVMIGFIYSFPPVLILCWVFGDIGVVNILGIMVAIVGLIMWVLGVTLITATLSTLWPDLRFFVTALMRLAFLATPVIWNVELLGEYAVYLYLNPFYVPLEVTRQTLTVVQVDWLLLTIFLGYSLTVLCLGIGIFATSLARLKSVSG